MEEKNCFNALLYWSGDLSFRGYCKAQWKKYWSMFRADLNRLEDAELFI